MNMLMCCSALGYVSSSENYAHRVYAKSALWMRFPSS